MLSGIGTLVGAITVLIAAAIGANTFKKWKQQKLAERKSDQAERILTAAYNVRRQLSAVRSRVISGWEFAEAEKELKNSGEWDKIFGGKAEQLRYTTAQVYYTRIYAAKEDRGNLYACQSMARAFFGEELEMAIEELDFQFRVVQIAVDANTQEPDPTDHADREFRRKNREIMAEGFPFPHNDVDRVIATQIAIIERICLPRLMLETRT